MKTIVLWNKFRDVVGASNDHPIATLFSRCSVPHCRAIFDRSKLSTSSAVLFHMAEFRLNDLPLSRDPSQHFVFTHFESVGNRYLVPSHRHWPQLDALSGGFFNLTMTYRTDSDVYFDAYAMYYRPHLISNWTALMAQKENGVLWLVSHCRTQSHREDYVGKLSKYLKVDKFGKCSGKGVKNPCVYGQCSDQFRRSYKFQLAFENRYNRHRKAPR
ncbi:hypothetical protein RvY_10555-2 [Ramazzottius varieornatus]|uniref:Fucosyltransferase n=1 Tax=Ramazzottius varieornatus TaxID=947166 RepID=A0A1D1VD50_RAMVA|nr:hypothetical protein RvY_10555-2 [Ramazzottius varieornatus]